MENFEDIEIDNLLDDSNLFKPLTDGLGFHHSLKQEKDVAISLQEKSLDLKSDLEARAKTLYASSQSTQISKLSTETPKVNPTSMGELSAFYSKPEEKNVELNLNSEIDNTTNQEADMTLRLMAWMMDSIIVISLIALIAISGVFASGIPFSFFSDNIYHFDIAFFVIAFSAMFNVFYYSFFDKTSFSTPGKRALGLKVQRLDGSNISLIQALNRSIISFFSIFSFGLFSILKLQDKLTDTIVVSK